VTQIGVVVRDMQAAMEAYHERLGWGPWSVFVLKAPHHHDTYLRGEQVEYSMQIAVTSVGGVDFEVIEPLEGPSIYKEFLEQRGEGVHHILCERPGAGPGELLAKLERQGLENVMGGQVGGSLRYQYLDAERELGLVIETYSGDVEPPTYVWPPEDGA
jgi:methylmalonyl-CoA/ethylmalonyl-CoA epimerase